MVHLFVTLLKCVQKDNIKKGKHEKKKKKKKEDMNDGTSFFLYLPCTSSGSDVNSPTKSTQRSRNSSVTK